MFEASSTLITALMRTAVHDASSHQPEQHVQAECCSIEGDVSASPPHLHYLWCCRLRLHQHGTTASLWQLLQPIKHLCQPAEHVHPCQPLWSRELLPASTAYSRYCCSCFMHAAAWHGHKLCK